MFLRAPDGSRKQYNNATVDQVSTGNLLLAYGFVPRMIGGNDAESAGEITALSTVPRSSAIRRPTRARSRASPSTTDDGVVELLAEPVTWGPDSNRTAYLVAEAAMDNYEAHGFTVASSRNCVLIKAPPGYGAGRQRLERCGDADRGRDHLRRQADGRWPGPGHWGDRPSAVFHPDDPGRSALSGRCSSSRPPGGSS